MNRGKTILEGIDRACSAVIAAGWWIMFGSIAHARQASDLDAITIPYSDGEKLSLVFPIMFAASTVRALGGGVQTYITVKKVNARLDELDPLADGVDVEAVEAERAIEHYTEARTWVDLSVGRLVPSVLIGVVAFSKKDQDYLLLATEASILLKQLLQIIFNSCILVHQEEEDREKRKYLAEPIVGLLTSAGLELAVYGALIDNPDDPSSTYTVLGMGAASAQLLLHIFKLAYLLCCASRGLARRNSARAEDWQEVDDPEDNEVLLQDEDAKGEDGEIRPVVARPQQQPGAGAAADRQEDGKAAQLPQSASTFKRAAGAPRALFRTASGRGPAGNERFAVLESAAEGKDDILLTSFQENRFLVPSESGGKLVVSTEKKSLKAAKLAQYGAVVEVAGTLNLQDSLARTATSKGTVLSQMWTAATGGGRSTGPGLGAPRQPGASVGGAGRGAPRRGPPLGPPPPHLGRGRGVPPPPEGPQQEGPPPPAVLGMGPGGRGNGAAAQ